MACRLKTQTVSKWYNLAYGALDGDCDNMVCVLKLVTHPVKAYKFGVKVKGLTEASREKLSNALACQPQRRTDVGEIASTTDGNTKSRQLSFAREQP